MLGVVGAALDARGAVVWPGVARSAAGTVPASAPLVATRRVPTTAVDSAIGTNSFARRRPKAVGECGNDRRPEDVVSPGRRPLAPPRRPPAHRGGRRGSPPPGGQLVAAARSGASALLHATTWSSTVVSCPAANWFGLNTL
ncbi:hypothetical protein GCM10023322_63850 [Rugosimonospora acidiphila]|uniref:Uncharacterized protein n=1 Tax=Rugosimonospora acidiphila TaxID=556531 RepID=A0ABP9SIG6_9ACTN